MPEDLKDSLPNPINKETKIPVVENGYWFLVDRYTKATNKYNYSKMFGRSSLNYSVAVLDTVSNILYIYTIDT